MKLSELKRICQTGIEKYGDLEIGFCETERSSEIEVVKDCTWNKIDARFIIEYSLPGIPITEEEQDINTTPFIVMFLIDE